MYQDNPKLPQEEPEDLSVEVDAVFDAEKESPPAFHAEGQPSQKIEDEELADKIADGEVIGQENMGERKIITVAPTDEERIFFVMIEGKEFKPEGVAQALEEAETIFGSYDLAVDEYKVGNKKKWAISQALRFKGVDMRRTVPSVRLSAAREIYGFLVNKGQEDRFTLLKPAYLTPEKAALENPSFFHKNRGYEA